MIEYKLNIIPTFFRVGLICNHLGLLRRLRGAARGVVRLSIRARLPKPLNVVPVGTSRETAIIHQVDLQSLMVHFSARLANGDFVCTLPFSQRFSDIFISLDLFSTSPFR